MGNFIDFEKYKLRKKKVDSMDLKEFAKLVIYFANHTKNRLYKTKLNKLLFYTQFLFYKDYEKRLLNKEFICDYYGPVIQDIDSLLDQLEKLGLIEFKTNEYGKYVDTRYKLSEDNYSKEELFILKKVSEKFEDYSSSEISDYSHKESLWKESSLKDIIPLELACDLNEF